MRKASWGLSGGAGLCEFGCSCVRGDWGVWCADNPRVCSMAVFVVESSVKSVTSPCTQRSRSPDRGFSDKSVRGDCVYHELTTFKTWFTKMNSVSLIELVAFLRNSISMIKHWTISCIICITTLYILYSLKG